LGYKHFVPMGHYFLLHRSYMFVAKMMIIDIHCPVGQNKDIQKQ
jgi:hypothetical protein